MKENPVGVESNMDQLLQTEGDQSQETGDAEFVDILKARLKEVEKGSEWIRQCEDLLKEINQSLNPKVASGQELLDVAGGGDLLEVAVQYVGISEECEASINILIANIVGTCDPREMFTVFFEVINMYTKSRTLHLCIPLLQGLSIVFRRIKRRKAEFFKEAVPGLLDVGTTALKVLVDQIENEVEDEMYDSRYQLIPHYYVTDNVPSKLVDELVNLGNVMRQVCSCEENQRLHDVIVLYNLRLLALVSCADNAFEGATPRAVEDVMKLMSDSNFSVREILTRQLEEILHRYADGPVSPLSVTEDEGQLRRTRFEARIGGALAGICLWDQSSVLGIHNKDSPTATLVFDLLKSNIESSGRQGVSDVINFTSILLVPSGWKQDLCLQQRGLTLITSVLEVFKTVSSTIKVVQLDDDSVHIMAALKRIQDVIVSTSNSTLRKEAYNLLIKTIREFLPAPERYEALYDLITNCDHPSLVSLLLTCVKDEVANAWPRVSGPEMHREPCGHLTSPSTETLVEGTTSPFVSSQILQFIQCVLRARDGTPVELPSKIDAVVSALNLYRFLLIRESSGKTNYTHVLSHNQLVKGLRYWLLPTREQALKVKSVLEEEDFGACANVLLGINCLLSVLYRCVELVEQLQDSPIEHMI